MSIEHIIRAWKSEEDDQETLTIANPIGEELTDRELQEITGGFCKPNNDSCIFATCAAVNTGTHCGTGSIQ